ncbi:MAG: UDP-3-O-[3-hydroxymyristoyl] N-acetylglucosamine deacetylase [Bdellovibrionales bacterium]|nr:UDP-3-O-[3-hydroxymyristoyl] N-acetylglucosamine deacetylase [Bdellovibrionales bacterium]
MGLAETLPVRSTASRRILIIDDEAAICRELEKFFHSIGYDAISLHSGEGMEAALLSKPDLVLLDIWMPGKDGLTLLAEILEMESAPPVVMMSGHATISTAVRATQMGACDFLEKPLDLEVLLEKIGQVFDRCEDARLGDDPTEAFSPIEMSSSVVSAFNARDAVVPRKDIFGKQVFEGTKIPQRSLKHSTILYGQGLHSGRKSGITLEPLPANSGIHFVGVSQDTAVPAHVDHVESTGFATSLRRGGTSVKTIEHLLSALHAYRISNLLIKCNEEVPVFDGSAVDFCDTIEEVGIIEQPGDWYTLKVSSPVEYDSGKEKITIYPGEGFEVEYELHYPQPLGNQRMVFRLDNVADYRREIAPARTFGFVQDVGYLQAQGLAQGGRFDNFVLYGKDGALNQELRFPDEAVRHKILDLIGDLYLLGRPLEGRVVATMTGHSDNVGLLRAIQETAGK